MKNENSLIEWEKVSVLSITSDQVFGYGKGFTVSGGTDSSIINELMSGKPSKRNLPVFNLIKYRKKRGL